MVCLGFTLLLQFVECTCVPFHLSCSLLMALCFHQLQGFSVAGQENIQEILSKQLVLCQFCMAMSVLREGEHCQCVSTVYDVYVSICLCLFVCVCVPWLGTASAFCATCQFSDSFVAMTRLCSWIPCVGFASPISVLFMLLCCSIFYICLYVRSSVCLSSCRWKLCVQDL